MITTGYERILAKAVIAAPQLVALWFTLTCPCDVILECHKEVFFGCLALAAVLAGCLINL